MSRRDGRADAPLRSQPRQRFHQPLHAQDEAVQVAFQAEQSQAFHL
jgi:hypothetical protein